MNTINAVQQEFAQAIQEGRQPNCPYCGKPLQVEQTQHDYIRWEWRRDHRQFLKATYGDAGAPHCMACGAADENFLTFTSEVSGLCAKLGLDY